MAKKKILIVGQSRWTDCPSINSSLNGVPFLKVLSHPDTIEHVYGMVNGIEGLFEYDCITLISKKALPGEDS